MQEIPVLSNVCSTHAKNAYKQYHAQLTPLRMIRNFPLRKCHRKRTKSRINFAAYLVRHIFISVYFSFSTDSRRLFPELIFITELVTIVGIIIDTIFALLGDV